MQEYYLAKFSNSVPMQLKGITLGELDAHWHRDIEIIFVLKGSTDIKIDGNIFHLDEDDLVVINSNSIHQLKSKTNCTAVSLKINPDGLSCGDTYFDCNSSTDNDKGRYYSLKSSVAYLVKENCSKDVTDDYFNLASAYNILHILEAHFKGDKANAPTQKYADRVNRIINYIETNYKDAITLTQLAEHEHLSVPYLSSFFDKYFGVNFTTYYNDVRMRHAVNQLLSSGDSIENIAYDNGFTDPRSFVNLFKKKYDTLPSLYRKQNSDNKNAATEDEDNILPLQQSVLLLLAKYLPTKLSNEPETDETPAEIKHLNAENISLNSTVKTLKHTFKVFTSVARAKELLFDEVKKELAELQGKMHYEYIKFHGLLSDDMLVYTEDKKGNPRYSFVYIDKVFDFLLSIGLKPLVQFSFMPSALASDKDHNAYASPFNVSPPKDMKKWCDLIEALTLHLIDRYSLKTVKSWLFCVWNEPDTTEYIFGFKRDEDFYELYKATYCTVKKINKSLVFGSPSLLISYKYNQDWCERFILWCIQNGCVPEFMNIHYYDNDFTPESFSTHSPGHPSHGRLNMDEYSFNRCIKNMKSLFSQLGIADLPVYLTEWNLTVSHENLLNDTSFKACYLVKNLLENYDELDSFGYWTLTDFMEELQPSMEQFHGGLGLYTIDGIKKPHFYVFEFLNKLGNQLIARGEGYFITKSYGGIQIILYNYEHFNHLYASGEKFDRNFMEKYAPFSRMGKADVSLALTDIPSKKCIIRENVLNQDHGSAFDEWIKMGAPDLTKEDIEYLKQKSVPEVYVRTEEIENGTLTLNAFLDPLEVRLIEITLK